MSASLRFLRLTTDDVVTIPSPPPDLSCVILSAHLVVPRTASDASATGAPDARLSGRHARSPHLDRRLLRKAPFRSSKRCVADSAGDEREQRRTRTRADHQRGFADALSISYSRSSGVSFRTCKMLHASRGKAITTGGSVGRRGLGVGDEKAGRERAGGTTRNALRDGGWHSWAVFHRDLGLLRELGATAGARRPSPARIAPPTTLRTTKENPPADHLPLLPARWSKRQQSLHKSDRPADPRLRTLLAPTLRPRRACPLPILYLLLPASRKPPRLLFDPQDTAAEPR